MSSSRVLFCTLGDQGRMFMGTCVFVVIALSSEKNHVYSVVRLMKNTVILRFCGIAGRLSSPP